MKYLTIKDKKKREEFLKLELKLLYLKALIFEAGKISNDKLLLKFLVQFKKLHTKVNQIKFKNRCLITSRSKAVYRDLKLSRIMFRNIVKLGFSSGIRKSSW
jgi:ribosomal protein S14